uniref:Uncharacterized protein n=1 Tax=Picea sitchensis TaxID=3332 RepID=A9NSM7_PICSI|nr:unknown [Picea sitchensis]
MKKVKNAQNYDAETALFSGDQYIVLPSYHVKFPF